MPAPTSNIIGQNLNTTTYPTAPQINVTNNPYGTPGIISPPKTNSNIIPIKGYSGSAISPQGGIQGSAGATGITGVLPPPQTQPVLKSGDPGTMTDPVTGKVFPIPGYKPPSTPPAPVSPLPSQISGGALTPEQIAAGEKSYQDRIKQETPLNTTPGTPGGPQYNPGNITYPSLVAGVANMSAQPTSLFNQESQAALDYQKQLNDLRQQEAQGIGNIEKSGGTPISQALGEEGAINRLYAGRENALAQAFSGAAGLLPTATAQQNAQIAGTLGATGAIAPQQAGPTNVPFNPATGQYGTPAVGAYGGGGLQGLGNVLQQQQIGADVAQQNAFLGSAQTTGENLQNLITSNDINPSAFTPLNGLLQLGANYTSNTAYQEFAGQINDFVNKIAPILGGPGGATTNYKTQLAGSILSSWAKGQSINDVISYFLNQAKQNIQGYSAGAGVTTGSANGTSNTNPYSWDFGK